MLGIIHLIIIAVVGILCYLLLFKPTVVNNKRENFNSDHIDYHKGNDYNIINDNNHYEQDNDNQDNNQDINNDYNDN